MARVKTKFIILFPKPGERLGKPPAKKRVKQTKN